MGCGWRNCTRLPLHCCWRPKASVVDEFEVGILALPSPALADEPVETLALPLIERSTETEPAAMPQTNTLQQQMFSMASVQSETQHTVIRADPDAFFDGRYLPNLHQMVDQVVADKAPLPLNSLAREFARIHAWLRTGKR